MKVKINVSDNVVEFTVTVEHVVTDKDVIIHGLMQKYSDWYESTNQEADDVLGQLLYATRKRHKIHGKMDAKDVKNFLPDGVSEQDAVRVLGNLGLLK